MKSSCSRNVLIAILIVLPALLLGTALRALAQDYLTNSAFRQLKNNSQVLSDLAYAYYADGKMTNMQFLINLDLASEISGADAVISDREGYIVACSNSTNGCDHQGLKISKEYMDRVVENNGATDTGIVKGLYTETRYISASPIYSSLTGQAIGIVIVSMPVEPSQQVLQRFSHIFFIVCTLVMITALISVNYISRQHNRPLHEMAKTAAAFGHGNLDARVKIAGSYPAEVEELALSFNNMASSLQKSEYSRQEFVANVSHELKTPMTTISGYVDGMLDGTIPPEKQEYYMRIVSAETKRLSRLVRSMLDISQLQSEGGIPEEKMSRFDMEECVGQVLITFEQKILSKKINVDVDMPEHPVFTIANQDYISQVVYNLMDNAVKFCPEDGVLTIRIREGNSKMFVSIINDGETIPPEELSLLFDRFHKIDKSRSKNRDGWGLGLYIVKTIIGLHGEDISVTSSHGKTDFTFTLSLVN